MGRDYHDLYVGHHCRAGVHRVEQRGRVMARPQNHSAVEHYLYLHGPATISQISRVTKLCRATVAGIVKEMHDAGVAYIANWHDSRIPRYKMQALLGNADAEIKGDAPRPKRLTGSQRVARWRKSHPKAVSVAVENVPHLAQAPIATEPPAMDWSAICGEVDE